MLKLENLVKKIKKKLIIDNINLEIPPKSYLGLIGPNGAGKTTILNMISGFYKLSKGKIYFRDKNMINLRKHRRYIGYFQQDFQFPQNLKVSELINYMLLSAYSDASERANFLNQWSEMLNLKKFFDQKVREISTGELQRLNLFQAIVKYPPILLLDEPFIAMDVTHRNLVKEFLKKGYPENEVTVISSHNLNDFLATLCDQFLFLDNGKVIRYLSSKELNDRFHSIPVQHDSTAGQIIETIQKIEGISYKKIKSGAEYIIIEFEKDSSLADYSQLSVFNIGKPSLEDIYLYFYS